MLLPNSNIINFTGKKQICLYQKKILNRNNPNAWIQAWGKADLHYHPFYLWPENNFFYVESNASKYNLLFHTSTKKIPNEDLIKTITKTEHAALKTLLSKDVIEIKELIDKIGASNEFNVSFIRRNFFIYDDSNFITSTWITEINKKIQVYGQVVVDTTELNTINNVIKSVEPLKFNVKKLTYKNKIVLQIEDIREKKKIETYDSKIKNITIVSVKKDKANCRKEEIFDVVDTVSIIGLESFDSYTHLNPISITNSNNDLIGYLTQSKNTSTDLFLEVFYLVRRLRTIHKLFM